MPNLSVSAVNLNVNDVILSTYFHFLFNWNILFDGVLQSYLKMKFLLNLEHFQVLLGPCTLFIALPLIIKGNRRYCFEPLGFRYYIDPSECHCLPNLCSAIFSIMKN
jgi:hypothetical protein